MLPPSSPLALCHGQGYKLDRWAGWALIAGSSQGVPGRLGFSSVQEKDIEQEQMNSFSTCKQVRIFVLHEMNKSH